MEEKRYKPKIKIFDIKNFMYNEKQTKPIKIKNEITTPVKNFTNSYNNLFGHFFIFKKLHIRKIYLERYHKYKKSRHRNLGKAAHLNKLDWETNYNRLHRKNKEDFFYEYFNINQDNYTENLQRLFLLKVFTTTKTVKSELK